MTARIADTIDMLGVLKAQIAELETQQKALRAKLDHLGPGAYEGDLYRLTISDSVRESPDQQLKAAIDALVKEHLSRQFITAHTNETPVRTLRVVARNGKAVAA